MAEPIKAPSGVIKEQLLRKELVAGRFEKFSQMRNRIEGLLFRRQKGETDKVARELAVINDNLATYEFGKSGVMRMMIGEDLNNPKAVFDVKREPDGRVYFFSSIAQEGQVGFKTTMQEGIVLGADTSMGPDETILKRMGLAQVMKKNGKGIAIEAVGNELWVLDTRDDKGNKIRVISMDKEPENVTKAKELPVQYDNTLVPPITFRAGPSENWTLVSRSPSRQGDLILARVNADKSVDYKSWSEQSFCSENNISKQAFKVVPFVKTPN